MNRSAGALSIGKLVFVPGTGCIEGEELSRTNTLIGLFWPGY